MAKVDWPTARGSRGKRTKEPRHEQSNTARIFDQGIYHRNGFTEVEHYDSKTDTVINAKVLNNSLEHEARFYGVAECSNLLVGSNPFATPEDVKVDRKVKGINKREFDDPNVK